jgi:LmbE family N-acetylglucosaminyl deacetylase
MAVHFYLSPHLDDAVLSCGGLIANQVAGGEGVMVLTVCAGDPGQEPYSEFAQAQHARWGGAMVGDRRTEDRMACGRLGASVVHLDLPDAIYRRGPSGEVLYPSEEAIFGMPHPSESTLAVSLANRLTTACPMSAQVYCPSAMGGHVDHRLTRLAAERADWDLWYYQDFPYAARGGNLPPDLPLPPGEEVVFPLSSEEIQAWAAAISEYPSQLPTFWPDVYTLYQEVRTFHDRAGGIRLVGVKAVPSPLPDS